MNKKQRILSCLLSVILVAVLVISFTNCVYVVHHPAWSPLSSYDFTEANKITTFYTNYSPIWVCVFTVIQLILLWVLRKPFACWFGIVLNIVGTIFPSVSMIMEEPLIKMMDS